MKKTIIICSGIPCSGKSTWSKEFQTNLSQKEKIVSIISRDDIRNEISKNYIHNKQNENKVTVIFYDKLNSYLNNKFIDIIILDNTYCKESYIDHIINEYGKDYNIQIMFFDISLFQAKLRNINRWYYTKKWIPIEVMNNMYKNYNKINKNKYAKYYFQS